MNIAIDHSWANLVELSRKSYVSVAGSGVNCNSPGTGKPLPKYLSTGNDPLFLYHRWLTNLCVLDIEKIKSVPHVSTSHPFVARVIGTTRREFLDQTLFFNKRDLQKKLNEFQQYYNETRGHSSLGSNTPKSTADGSIVNKKDRLSADYGWKSYCNGLCKFPVVTYLPRGFRHWNATLLSVMR